MAQEPGSPSQHPACACGFPVCRISPEGECASQRQHRHTDKHTDIQRDIHSTHRLAQPHHLPWTRCCLHITDILPADLLDPQVQTAGGVPGSPEHWHSPSAHPTALPASCTRCPAHGCPAHCPAQPAAPSTQRQRSHPAPRAPHTPQTCSPHTWHSPRGSELCSCSSCQRSPSLAPRWALPRSRFPAHSGAHPSAGRNPTLFLPTAVPGASWWPFRRDWM